MENIKPLEVKLDANQHREHLEQKLLAQQPMVEMPDKYTELLTKQNQLIDEMVEVVEQSKFERSKPASERRTGLARLFDTISSGIKDSILSVAPELAPVFQATEKISKFVKESTSSVKQIIKERKTLRMERKKTQQSEKSRSNSQVITKNQKQAEQTTKAVTSIQSGVETTAPMIQKSSKAILGLVGLKKVLVAGIALLTAGLVTFLISQSEKLMGWLNEYVYEPITKLVDSIKTAWSDFKSFMTSLPEKIADGFKATVQTLNPFKSETIDAVKETASTTFEKTSSSISSSKDYVFDSFSTSFPNATERVSETATATVEKASEYYDKATSWFNSAWSLISDIKSDHSDRQIDVKYSTSAYEMSSDASETVGSQTISELQQSISNTEKAIELERKNREQQAHQAMYSMSTNNVSNTTNNYSGGFSFVGDEGMGMLNYGAQPVR
ncbi:hypothetical protein LA020_002890 [Vibrio alginolyticus]|nr:hypothetical protein [Vibrio alginolyticus]